MVAAFLDGNHYYQADTCKALRASARRGELDFHALARETYPGERLPPDALPGLKSVGFWDAPRDLNWGLDWHRNEGVEITCLTRGQVGFSVDDLDFDLNRGSLTVTRPWQEHRVGRPHVKACLLHWLILDVDVRQPGQKWIWPDWIMLSEDEIGRLTRLLQGNEHPVWEAAGNFCQTFEDIAAKVSDRDCRTRISSLALLINRLLLDLLELLEQNPTMIDGTQTSTRRGVALFLERLKDRLDEDWTLDSMAMACGLGRTQFASHCKDLTNMTPLRYLKECRLQAAKSLLGARDSASITDVAMACGFSSSQYFSNVFKRQTGLSPTQFSQSRQAPH